jgi:hypothetical protein
VGIYQARMQRASTGEDITYLRFAFCGELGAQQAGRQLDTGIIRAVWLSPAEIRASVAQHRSPMLLRCMEDYLRGQRFPVSLIHTDPNVFCLAGLLANS